MDVTLAFLFVVDGLPSLFLFFFLVIKKPDYNILCTHSIWGGEKGWTIHIFLMGFEGVPATGTKVSMQP